MEETQGYDQVTGTLEELVEALEERALGWHYMASDKKRDRALEAAQSLRDGSFSVKVGNTIYSVARPGNSDDVPEQRATRDEKADRTVS